LNAERAIELAPTAKPRRRRPHQLEWMSILIQYLGLGDTIVQWRFFDVEVRFQQQWIWFRRRRRDEAGQPKARLLMPAGLVAAKPEAASDGRLNHETFDKGVGI